MKNYVVSDTHFNHDNIIRYCNRPFNSIDEMNKCLIENWNKVVTPDDTVFFLGDFTLGSKDSIKDFAEQLNGKKIFILGNHDRAAKNYREAGFELVVKNFTIPSSVYNTKQYITLTHAPIVSSGYNIHGHIHNMLLHPMFDEETHFNACVENINYKPIDIAEIIAQKNW